MELHIGLDDIDSLSGGCTTHAATLLACNIRSEFGVELLEPLNLVRLNPSIPWKTRGNGAVALRIKVEDSVVNDLIRYVRRFVEAYISEFRGSLQDPGVAIVVGSIPTDLAKFYRKAIHDVVPTDLAIRLARRHNIEIVFDGKGVVGALAAIGWILERRDYSYELLVYRSRENLGKRERCINVRTLIEYDTKCSRTFNNIYDGKPLITPHGVDPVLYGFRGDDPSEVLGALTGIELCERVAAYALFITNQGTDDHTQFRIYSLQARNYRCGWIIASVVSRPRQLPGGHVVLELHDEVGRLKAIVFRETGFSNVAKELNIGTRLYMQGCFKPYGNEPFLHVEKLLILSAEPTRIRPRICPRCGSKMKYRGLGRGYRCTKCGLKIHLAPAKQYLTPLKPSIILPPPHRQKHLVKPISRYGSTLVPTHEAVVECYEPLCF